MRIADADGDQSQNKAKPALTKQQFTEVFMTLVKTATESFRDKWNKANPGNTIDLRFTMSKVKVSTHTHIRAQASLAFEISRKGLWEVASRTVKNLASERLLVSMEQDYTMELWSDMFSEITQIGFISVINYLDNKGSEQQTKEEDYQRPTLARDCVEAEDTQG